MADSDHEPQSRPDDAPLTLRTAPSIQEIGRDAWDGLAAAASAAFDPFTSYAFLDALEKSKSVGSVTGWLVNHACLYRGETLIGAAPLYVKSNSQGEYIFDHHWADAYMRAGGRYYPKLLCAAPFTPVAGARLLAADHEARTMLAGAMAQIAQRIEASSVHINFVTDADETAAQQAGYLMRRGVQYHWFNRGYESFDQFLETMSSRKRKTVRRERRDAAASGLTIRRLVGNEITQRHWDAFWRFYQDTGARKWGTPYLTRTFFDIIAATMADQLLLIVAERDGEPIAGALNMIGSDALYGRYWGCTEHYPFLHFELCYHQAIEFAIERGLARVEAGAQGDHKIARGYEPVATRSAHWISDPGFSDAIANYLQAERNQTDEEIDYLADFTPFKKAP